MGGPRGLCAAARCPAAEQKQSSSTQHNEQGTAFNKRVGAGRRRRPASVRGAVRAGDQARSFGGVVWGAASKWASCSDVLRAVQRTRHSLGRRAPDKGMGGGLNQMAAAAQRPRPQLGSARQWEHTSMPATEGRLGGPTGLHHLTGLRLDDGAGRNGLVAEHHHNAAARRKGAAGTDIRASTKR